MNKYVFAECSTDYWPQIETISAPSYKDAVERLIIKYGERFDDDVILSSIEDWEELREHLNDNYSLALSDLEDYEEL